MAVAPESRRVWPVAGGTLRILLVLVALLFVILYLAVSHNGDFLAYGLAAAAVAIVVP